MTTALNQTVSGLPATHRSSTLAERLSLALAAVAGAGAALTLFVPGVLHGPAAMNGSARGTAAVLLGLGVPVLVGLSLTRRDTLVPVRLGVLGYVLYQCVLFLLGTPFNELFPVYTAMTALCLAAVVIQCRELDVAAIGARFRSAGLARGLAGYLGFIVVANTAVWLSGLLPGLRHAQAPAFLIGTGLTTNPTYVQDFSFWLPLGGLAAWWLWSRRPWGVVLGGAYLAMWTLECCSVAVDQWLGSRADPSSTVVSSSLVLPFVILAVVTFLALIGYLRGIADR